MANMEDYFDWRGDIPFSVDPFNEVDNIILAELVYAPLKGYIPGPGLKETVAVADVCDAFFKDHTDEEILAQNMSIKVAPFLLRKMKNSKRYEDVKLTGFVDEYDEKSEKQFAAMTYLLPDNTYYVAFRGTDATVVGWKEDFNMAFMTHTAGQLAAMNYLNNTFKHAHRKLRVGGHSKGANFAVYAAAFCDEAIRKKIINVYSNDGPGFKEEISKSAEYQNILPKVLSYVPEQSMIGMILTGSLDHHVVKSTNVGAYQHDAMSWQVLGNHFDYAEDGLSETSVMLSETLDDWLDGIDDETREIFVDAIFNVVLSKENAVLDDYLSSPSAFAAALVKTRDSMPKEKQQIVEDVIKKLIHSGNATLKNSIRSKIDAAKDRSAEYEIYFMEH